MGAVVLVGPVEYLTAERAEGVGVAAPLVADVGRGEADLSDVGSRSGGKLTSRNVTSAWRKYAPLVTLGVPKTVTDVGLGLPPLLR